MKPETLTENPQRPTGVAVQRVVRLPDEIKYVVKLEQGWWLSQTATGDTAVWVNLHERDKAMKMSYAEARIRADRYNKGYCEPQAFVERETPLGEAA